MVLLICANFPPEPVMAAGLSYDLAMALSEKNEVTVITPRPSRPCGFAFDAGSIHDGKFEHVILSSYTCPRSTISGRMLESYSFGRHAVRYIKKKRNDISCLYISVWPLLAQYLIIKASLQYSIPSVVHVQDIYPESLSNKIGFLGGFVNKVLLPLDKFILHHASSIVANSESMRSAFEKTRGIPSNKMNWLDESKFLQSNSLYANQLNNQLDVKPFTFMYLGNIGPVAGVDFIISSFSKAGIPGAILVIAGAGSQKDKCMEIAKSYKNPNILFTDVPSGKVTEIQQSADIFMLPTRKGASLSSIPSKLISYMFSGKPVIACVEDESDIASAIKLSNCGWIVAPEDTESLIRVMRKVNSTPVKELSHFGNNGFNYAMKYFSKRKNSQLLASIIMQVLKSDKNRMPACGQTISVTM